MKNFLLHTLLTVLLVSGLASEPFAQQLRPLQPGDKTRAHQQVRENTNAERLNELARQYDEEHRLEMQQALEIAYRDSLPVWHKSKDGKIFVLSGLDGSGQLEYTETNNLTAARTTSTDDVWAGGSAGLSLSGAGFVIGLWEAGGIPLISHQELVGRVSVAAGQTSTLSDHASHVSGTMIATGVVANARGMANGASIAAYDSGNDNTEMATAAANGMLISNHSYGTITGWYYNSDDDEWYWYGNTTVSTIEDYKFGLYDTRARQWDEVTYNAPYFLPVKSAGNDRDDNHTGSHYVMQNNQWVLSTAFRDPDGGSDGYDCVPTYGTAKNILTVGAIYDIPNGYQSPGDVDISNFSGWGPTDDGRIKPDVVGNGVGLNSSISSGTSQYSSFSGTSMSSPNVAGSLVLLQEHCFNEFGVFMRSATLKALAIHTADESGSAVGPDYQHGWGLLNTRKAANLITTAANGGDAGIFEDVLNNGQSLDLTYTSDGTKPIRVTIAWTDPAGTATGNVLNSTVRKLVNDLDLRGSKDGTTYFPYTLNPSSPSAPASNTQDNNRDNVEQIYIANPTAGTYTFTISHKGTLSGSPQPFSLIFTAESGTTGGGGCSGNTTLNSCTGTVTDGSGSANYANNLDCSWTISPPGAASVTLIFTSFDTESCCDYVAVYDGTSTSGTLLGQFAGSSLPPTLTANSGSMFILFHTDGSVVRAGWSANYACGTGGTNTCDQAIPINCGSTVTGVTSGAPQNVPDCGYSLNTAPGQWYRFMGQGAPVRMSTCNPGSNYDTKIGVFSGSCSNLVCVIGSDDDPACTQNDLLSTVEFSAQSGVTYYIYVTGYNNEAGAFELSVECLTPICQGSTTLTSCTGTVTDGSGNSNYSNNMDCTWTISPPGAASVTLNFSSFATETCCDYVAVYDGTSTSGTLLGQFAGFSLPPMLTANSGSMFILFHTDGSVVEAGWSANYSCNTGGANNCDQAIPINCGSTVTGVTSGAPQNVPDCGYSLNTAPGQWYRFTGQGAPVRMSTCNSGSNYDTKIGVFSGSCSNLVCVIGSDDDPACTQNDLLSTVEFSAQTGVTYYIYVTGYDNNAGSFQLSVECLTPICQGGTTLTACSGAVSDGSGNSNYSNNMDCTWTISPPGATSVMLNFTSFATETCCDYVAVYDGASTSGTLLGQFAGFSLPPTLTANSGSMFVLFHTDGSVVEAGWSANYSCNTTAAPVADFVGNPSSGVAPHTVNFTDLSANAPTSWSWNFGNGQTSTQQNPVYTYTQAGTYSVSLTVTNAAGSSMVTKTNYITVTNNVQVPIANFNASVTCGQLPLTVQFTDASANNPANWSWNFGTGQNSTQQNPSFTYTQPGVYTVTLSVSNAAGTDVEEKTGYITVVAPVSVTATPGNQTCIGTSVLLQASGASQYAWTGTGLSGNSGAVVSALPTVPGTYNYTVIGTTNNCASAPTTLSITFHPIPTVNVTPSSGTICAGETLTLTAGGASTYQWSGTGLSSNTGNPVSAMLNVPGNYTYTVVGTANGCTSTPQSTSVQVQAINQLSVTIAMDGCPGPNLTFTANVVNGGNSPNILWYRNGQPAWNGPTYTLLGAVNGDAVYCEVAPVNPPACTQPVMAQSAVTTVNCIVGVKNIEELESAVLMPNPNDGDFRLQLELSRPIQGNLQIFNALGQLMLEQKVTLAQGSNTLPVSLPAPAPGVYWLVLQSDGRIHRMGFEVR